ncbi:MAG: hypothetical protein AMXMBFR72_34250, partial [Betaproteobacteria bacterium]
ACSPTRRCSASAGPPPAAGT